MNTITHNILVTVVPSKKFQNQLKKQVSSARGFKALAIAAIVCAVASEVERRKLDEQVYQLTVRVKKLEHSEGE